MINFSAKRRSSTLHVIVGLALISGFCSLLAGYGCFFLQSSKQSAMRANVGVIDQGNWYFSNFSNTWTEHSSGIMFCVEDHVSANIEYSGDPKVVIFRTRAWGFPFQSHCLIDVVKSGYIVNVSQRSPSVSQGNESSWCPTILLTMPLLGNAIIYFIILMVLYHGALWVLVSRKSKYGKCSHCGYDTDGLRGEQCPECGTSLQSARSFRGN
jgi:hypothetical protein